MLHSPLKKENLSTFNIAQYLETKKGFKWLLQGIKQQMHQAELIILPPILVTTFLTHLLNEIEKILVILFENVISYLLL